MKVDRLAWWLIVTLGLVISVVGSATLTTVALVAWAAYNLASDREQPWTRTT